MSVEFVSIAGRFLAALASPGSPQSAPSAGRQMEGMGSFTLDSCSHCPFTIRAFATGAAVLLVLLLLSALGATSRRTWTIALGRLGLILVFLLQTIFSLGTVRNGVTTGASQWEAPTPGLAAWLIGAVTVVSLMTAIVLWRWRRTRP